MTGVPCDANPLRLLHIGRGVWKSAAKCTGCRVCRRNNRTDQLIVVCLVQTASDTSQTHSGNDIAMPVEHRCRKACRVNLEPANRLRIAKPSRLLHASQQLIPAHRFGRVSPIWRAREERLRLVLWQMCQIDNPRSGGMKRQNLCRIDPDSRRPVWLAERDRRQTGIRGQGGMAGFARFPRSD